MNAERLTVLAPPKVNLYLEVGSVRPDGYHAVTTVLQSLDDSVADVVEIVPSGSLRVTCTPDIGVPEEANLVTRALRTFAEQAGYEPAFDVTVRKRIPSGAGLGGASSNAAAALLGACSIWGLDPLGEEVTAIARRLGADVAFFLRGGTALYVGRGDVLAEELPAPMVSFLLVNPGVPASTSQVYAAYDRLPRPVAPGVRPLLDALAEGDVPSVAAGLFNGLTDAACEVSPPVAHVLAILDSTEGVRGVLVSGSGSTAFGVYDDLVGAERAATLLTGRGWWAATAQPGGHGVRVIERRSVGASDAE